ncbi:MAG: polysaccharide deacetylase family protein [Agathobacter rectalis]
MFPVTTLGCILDALANCGVKATFFVTADTSGKYDDVYKRIVQDGHTIARWLPTVIHTVKFMNQQRHFYR